MTVLNTDIDNPRETITESLEFTPQATGQYLLGHFKSFEPDELNFNWEIPKTTFAEWRAMGI